MFRWRLLLLSLLMLTTLTALATSFTSTRISSDPNWDFEPTVTRQGSADGFTATIIAGIKYPGSVARNYYYTRGDNGQNFSGELPLPAGETFNYSADPYLAPNQTGGGPYRYRTYLVGAFGNNTSSPKAIGVWRSDDAGRSWTLPVIVARVNLGDTTTDKPHIAVSQASTSSGHVYVVYMRRISTTTWQIRIVRSTDGGVTWGSDSEVHSASTSLNCAQVVVEPDGNLQVVWIDYDQNRIQSARTTSPGAINSWAKDLTGIAGSFFRGGSQLNGLVPAQTVPVARYNWVTNKLVVVWHERETLDPNKADVYVSARTASGWQPKQRINSETCADGSGPQTRDQFRPAFDYRSTGQLYVTYYSRQRDCVNNLNYELYFVRLGDGNPYTTLEGPRPVGNFLSNLSNNANHVGEYHEVWCNATTCWSAWIGADLSSTWGDVWMTRIFN